jgi:hypothetical protein
MKQTQSQSGLAEKHHQANLLKDIANKNCAFF